MYHNLRTVLYHKRISIREYANFLGMTEKTAQNKLKGITDFTYSEFKKTCSTLLPEYNADFLFAADDEPMAGYAPEGKRA